LLPDVEPKLEYYCGRCPLKKDLMSLADDVCARTGLRVDREAKRNREYLLCWFCENWRTIQPMLHRLEKSGAGEYDTRPKIPRFPDVELAGLLRWCDDSVHDWWYFEWDMDY
jgi:hypothetical protein